MWKKTIMTSLITLALAPQVQAEMVYFPEEIIPLQVDDKEVEQSFFSTVDELELAPGQYRLKLQYSDLYESGFDDHQVVESEPFWVNLEVKAGEDYDVIFERASNAAAAELYAEAPTVRLQARGQKLAAPMASVAPAEAPQAKTVVSAKNPDKESLEAAQVVVDNNVSAAAMLDFWWQQASAQERQAFLEKVKANQQ